MPLPVALLLGSGKKEAIGACYSINRIQTSGSPLTFTALMLPETKREPCGLYSGIGYRNGIHELSLPASLACGTFSPPLGMASGVGSGSMMTAAAGNFRRRSIRITPMSFPFSEEPATCSPELLIYMGTFIGLPLTTWLYNRLEPKIGKIFARNTMEREVGGEAE